MNFPFIFQRPSLSFIVIAFLGLFYGSSPQGKACCCLFIYFCPFLQLIPSALVPVHSQGELSTFRIFTLYYKVSPHKYSTFLGYTRHLYCAIMRQMYYALWQKCMLSSSPKMIAANLKKKQKTCKNIYFEIRKG